MSAARVIENMGASVSLVAGKVKLAHLDRLDKETAARVLEVARSHRAELVTELAGKASNLPGPGRLKLETARHDVIVEPGLPGMDTGLASSQEDHACAMAELDRFFATAVPDGEGGWIDPAYKEKVRKAPWLLPDARAGHGQGRRG